MGMTQTQKILAAHAGLAEVKAGQLINAKLDIVLGNDITTPVAINEFEKAGFNGVFDKEHIAIVLDHFVPNKDIKSATQSKQCREFANKYDILNFYDVGQMGIEHALLPEKGLVAAGDSVRLPPFALGMSRRSKATGGQASPEQEPRQRTQALPPAPRPLQKDGDLWVFCKPAGLPTHPGTGHEDSLSSRLAARAGDAPFKPTPVHRLDKDTSGILLVAASFSVLRELTTALRERRMKKEYLAWVEGRWPHSGVRLFRHWLRKEAGTGNGREQMHVRQTGAPGNGETEALLLVRPVRVEDRRSLLLVRLLTGRTHQIRAQLSSLGHPIEGDVKYGARGRASGPPMYLHAMRVILPDGRRFACLPDWPADRLPQAVPDEIDEAAARQGN